MVDLVSTDGENQKVYTCREGHTWQTVFPSHRRVLQHNVLKCKSAGPGQDTKHLPAVDLFKLLINDTIADIIIRETNKKVKHEYELWNAQFPEKPRAFTQITLNEFYAFLGIVLHAGVHRSARENHKDLWKNKSHPIYRATMTRTRFSWLCQVLRFDNKDTRRERIINGDKAAGISDVWLILNTNLRANYNPGANITVDEQLYPYRGGTPFTQYIPSKPAKYGIKVWWVCDSQSWYPFQGQIYTGKAANGIRDKNQGKRVVKDLCKFFKGSVRNVTCDNFFTSYDLAQELMSEYRLSLLGTCNRIRRFLPAEFVNLKDRELGSTLSAISNNVSLCSYASKKKKVVVLLSTSHYDQQVSDAQNKPQMILDYNMYKGGVDTMDKMLTEYSTKRSTRRWTMAFFYNMIDIAGLASYIIDKENHPEIKRSSDDRKKYLEELALELAMPEINRRSTTNAIRNFGTKIAIENMIGKPILQIRKINIKAGKNANDKQENKQKGKCKICKELNNILRSSKRECAMCLNPVCAEHSEVSYGCFDCYDNCLA